jgi:hypothetical protein
MRAAVLEPVVNDNWGVDTDEIGPSRAPHHSRRVSVRLIGRVALSHLLLLEQARSTTTTSRVRSLNLMFEFGCFTRTGPFQRLFWLTGAPDFQQPQLCRAISISFDRSRSRVARCLESNGCRRLYRTSCARLVCTQLAASQITLVDDTTVCRRAVTAYNSILTNDRLAASTSENVIRYRSTRYINGDPMHIVGKWKHETLEPFCERARRIWSVRGPPIEELGDF